VQALKKRDISLFEVIVKGYVAWWTLYGTYYIVAAVAEKMARAGFAP